MILCLAGTISFFSCTADTAAVGLNDDAAASAGVSGLPAPSLRATADGTVTLPVAEGLDADDSTKWCIIII